MKILIMAFQCGIFIFIPLITIFIGIWKVLPKVKEKYQAVYTNLLVGFVFFEGTIIGLLIDPRTANRSFQEILMIAFIVGIVALLFTIVFIPIYTLMIKTFKK